MCVFYNSFIILYITFIFVYKHVFFIIFCDIHNVCYRVEEPVVKKEVGKKKVWKEDDKWNHDKFNEFDQSPKSREEIMAIYGYDIRNEGPPKAHCRRRYG